MTQTVFQTVDSRLALDLFRRFREYVHVEHDCCAFFEHAFLKRRGWKAVVSNEELTREEAEKVATACQQFGYASGFALDIDRYDPHKIYKILLDPVRLSSLEETFVTPSYLVVEKNEHFMIVSDSDYYWSIAGKGDFLDACFDKSLNEINNAFLEVARKYEAYGTPAGKWLNKIGREASVARLHL